MWLSAPDIQRWRGCLSSMFLLNSPRPRQNSTSSRKKMKNGSYAGSVSTLPPQTAGGARRSSLLACIDGPRPTLSVHLVKLQPISVVAAASSRFAWIRPAAPRGTTAVGLFRGTEHGPTMVSVGNRATATRQHLQYRCARSTCGRTSRSRS